MEPSPLSNPEWSDIGALLTNVWVIVGLVMFWATNFLIGHILIPSLVDSHDVPVAAHKTRPLFYGLAAISLVAVVVVLLQVIDQADVLDRFWPDYWI